MFLRLYILITVSATFVVAQTPDSLHASKDSIGSFTAPPVVIERTRDLQLVGPLIREADLRSLEHQSASSSLSQVLPLLHSSFDVRSYGTLGGISLPSFRGLPAEYIAVYRNGIRLTNAQNSLSDLERYTSRSTSHVSILSSTESALYNNGVGGAVVLIESKPHLNARTYTGGISLQTYDDAGSINDKEYFLRGSEPLGKVSINLSANYRTTNGAYPFYQRSTDSYVNRENNDAYLALAELEPVLILSDEEWLSGLFTFSEAERGVPGPNTVDGEGASTPETRQYDKDLLAGLTYRSKLTEAFYHELTMSWQSQYETYGDPIRQIDDRYTNRIVAAAYKSRIASADELTLFGDATFTRDMLESNQHTGGQDIARNRYAASAGARYQPSQSLGISSSFSLEQVSDMGGIQFLPAVAVNYRSGQFNVTGSASRFFHAPTFNQLYWRIGGDSSLHPEHGESYELRGSYDIPLEEQSSLTVQSTVFLTDIRDQIIWTPGSGGFSIPKQMQRVRTSGFELSVQFEEALSQNERIRLQTGLTLLNRTNLVESSLYYGKELPYSAALRINGNIEYKLQGTGSITAILWYRSKRYSDFANNPSAALPAVTTLDAHLRSKPIELPGVAVVPQLSVVNLTNEQYEDVLSYPLPGRIFKLSFDFTYSDE